MKKIILSLSLFLTVGAGIVFANDEAIVNEAAAKSFKREFRGAEFVTWSVEGEYSKATFVLGGHRTVAVFSAQGELLGSVRDLFYNQLPLVVSRAVDKRFANAAVSETTEVANADGTLYRLVLESNGKKYKVAVYPDGGFADVEKLKK